MSDVVSPNADETQATPPRPPAPRRRWLLPLVVVVVLFGAVFGFRWWQYSRAHVSTDDAQVDSDVYAVSPRVAGHIAEVKVDTGQTVSRGQVLAEIDPRDYAVAVEQAQAAYQQAIGAAQAAGGTVNVTQKTGGASIAQAASGVSAAQGGVAAAQAAVIAAQAQVGAAKAQVAANQRAAQAATAARQMAERDVKTAEANVAASRAQAEQAQRDADRNRFLVKQGAISKQLADQTDSAATTAQANLTAAEARQSSSRGGRRRRSGERASGRSGGGAVAGRGGCRRRPRWAARRPRQKQAVAGVGQAQATEESAQVSPVQVGVTRAQAKSAVANVAAAKARLDQAQLNLSYTRILSPVNGVVAVKNVERGQYVTSAQPLFSIVPSGGAFVTANFKETQLAHMRSGQPAIFAVDAYPGVTFTGHVEFLSPGTGSVFSLLPPENATGNFTKVVQRVPVRIVVDPELTAKYPLRTGMNVVATVDVSSR